MKEESAVAAVYDRRTENETGAHRDAANVSSFYKKIAVPDFLKIFRINPAATNSEITIIFSVILKNILLLFCFF